MGRREGTILSSRLGPHRSNAVAGRSVGVSLSLIPVCPMSSSDAAGPQLERRFAAPSAAPRSARARAVPANRATRPLSFLRPPILIRSENLLGEGGCRCRRRRRRCRHPHLPHRRRRRQRQLTGAPPSSSSATSLVYSVALPPRVSPSGGIDQQGK